MFCLKYLVLPITNRHLFFESLSSCSRPLFVPAVQCFKTDPISESGSAINRWPCHSLTDLHTFENTKENCDHHNYHFNHHYLHRYFSVIRAKHCFWLTSKKKRTKLPDLGRGGLLIWAMLERIKVTGDSTHKFTNFAMFYYHPFPLISKSYRSSQLQPFLKLPTCLQILSASVLKKSRLYIFQFRTILLIFLPVNGEPVFSRGQFEDFLGFSITGAAYLSKTPTSP